jgi:hypothetical protein
MPNMACTTTPKDLLVQVHAHEGGPADLTLIAPGALPGNSKSDTTFSYTTRQVTATDIQQPSLSIDGTPSQKVVSGDKVVLVGAPMLTMKVSLTPSASGVILSTGPTLVSSATDDGQPILLTNFSRDDALWLALLTIAVTVVPTLTTLAAASRRRRKNET